MPSPGKIKHITEPLGLGVRHDGYVYPGYEIPMYYDPMISKLIVWGTNREEAIARMRRALYAYKISGVSTSIPFLEKVMQHPVFIKGNYNTHFIDTYLKELLEVSECDGLCEDVAVITAFIHYLDELGRVQNGAHDGKVAIRESRWKQMGKSLNLRRN